MLRALRNLPWVPSPAPVRVATPTPPSLLVPVWVVFTRLLGVMIVLRNLVVMVLVGLNTLVPTIDWPKQDPCRWPWVNLTFMRRTATLTRILPRLTWNGFLILIWQLVDSRTNVFPVMVRFE